MSKKQDNELVDLLLKENFNLILIFCSLFTVYIVLSIIFADFERSFITVATIILLMFLLLTVLGIWVQKNHENNSLYYKILIGTFYVSTVIAVILCDIGETSSFLFIFSGLMLLLIFSGYLYTPIVLRTPLLLLILGSSILITHRYGQSNIYIIVSFIISMFTLFISRERYQRRINIYDNNMQITQMKNMLEQMSYKDVLTNLYNNHFIHQQLEYEINRSQRYHTPLCLVILDIDQFEKYNIQYGQLAGDDALSVIGNILTTNCRTTDIIGRHSGEEFIIILPNTSLDESILLSERLRLLINSNDFGYPSKLSVSVGVKEFRNESINELLRVTHANVELAKGHGRNFVYYDSIGG